MKQTAVEWVAEEAMKLVKQYMTGTLNEDTIEEDVYKIIIRGKEMEKEQLDKAYYQGQESKCIGGPLYTELYNK